MTKSLLMCLGKHSKDWTPDERAEMSDAFKGLIGGGMPELEAGRKVTLGLIGETETEIAQIEQVIEAHLAKKPKKGEGQGQAPPVKVAVRGAEALERGKKAEISPTNAEILKTAGLVVTKTLTKPKKAGKKPRPVWEVAGRIDPFVEIIRDLGGRKWGGKYSFWGDPTEDLAEAVSVQGGMSFAEQMGAKETRAEEKADRLEDRAGKARGKADAARKAEGRMAEHIPMGQPILVGHHSEKRARRDQDRIQKLTRDQITESDKANWLDDRVKLQRDVAKGEYTIRFMQNRVDDTEKDVRQFERILSGEQYGSDPIRNEQYRERIARDLADAQEKVEYWKSGIEAAGGINYSKENVSKGDRVWIRGAWCVVERANPKTVSIIVAEGGAKGMKLKYKYSEIQKAETEKPVEEKPAAKEVEKPAEEAAIPEPAPKEVAAPLDKKQKAKIVSLRKGADNLQKTIDEKRNPAVATQNLTAKRARQASSMGADADWLERTQMVMRGLADDTENGTLPEMFMGIGTKAQIDQIIKTKNSSFPGFHKSRMSDLIAAVKGVKGLASERMVIADMSRRVRHSEYQVDLRTTDEIKAVEAAIRQDPGNLSRIKEGILEGKRLIALNIHNQEEYEVFRDKLYSYINPPDPVTQTQAKIREKEAALIGVKIPGFFPTPAPVGALMVEAADIQPGDYILEPSSGKGDLAVVIKEAHPNNPMQVAEIGHTMREILELKGFDIIGHDFLDMVLSKPGVQGLDIAYDKIIQNPPFENFQDIDHIYHAYELLAPGGRLVSLMSESPFFRSEKKAVEFREWLDKVGAEVHKLEDKSFTGAEAFRQTGVSARMVVIDKPGKKVERTAKEIAEIAKKQRKARVEKGETLFSKEVREVPTVYDVKQAQKGLHILKNTLSKVLPKDVMARITTNAAPILKFDLTRTDTQKSLAEHGGELESISGATTINDFHALVEIAYNYENDAMESTAYHEAFHVGCKWLLPNKEYADLMRYFKGNEEHAANAFSGFAMGVKGKELNTHPNFIKAIFLKLRRYFQMVRNALQGRGFARPEDVFGKLIVGEYKIMVPESVIRSRLRLTPEQTHYSKVETPAEPMYSQLVKAVDYAKDMPRKVPSLLKWLQKKAKPEEIKWLDAEEWLSVNAGKDGRIDKDQFLAYLKDHQISIHEMVRYERGSAFPDQLQWSTPELLEQRPLFDEDIEADYDLDTVNLDTLEYQSYAVDYASQDVYTIIGSDDAGFNLFLELDGSNEKEHLANTDTISMANDLANEDLAERYTFPEARYEGQTIEGGSDYKELLFTYPPRSVKNNFKVIRSEGKFQIKDTMDNVLWPTTSPWGFFYDTFNEAQAKAIDLNWEYHKYGIEAEPNFYRSSHWGETNVLAHSRFKSRRDSNGRKVLFIEEVQSDWHQTGQEIGYKGDDALEGPRITIEPNTGQLGDAATARYWAVSNGVILGGGWTESEARIRGQEVLENAEDERLIRPPRAPFGKTWHEYVMKRMLRWASENGFDTLAWTTGKQQIRRYDLRHHIDLITWQSTGINITPGTTVSPRVNIRAFYKGEQKLQRKVGIMTQLDNLLGKNMANQIRAAINRRETEGNIEPKDMTVGGRGMESFYDELIPGFMRKYGKQWGATVGQIKVVTGSQQDVSNYFGPDLDRYYLEGIRESMASAEIPLSTRDYHALTQVIGTMKHFGTKFKVAMMNNGTKGLAEYLGGELVATYFDVTEDAHSIDITPAMREDVIQTGQTMFEEKKKAGGQAWAQQFIADALADAADNPKDKKAQAKAKRIRTEQEWFTKDFPKQAYESTKAVIKAFKMGKKKGWVGMKPDTTFLERWLQTPEFYYKKVPAAWRVFMASLDRQDNYNQFYSDLTNKDELLAEIQTFKKADPKEYARLGKLLIRADQIKATHGPKSLRELGFSDQAIAAFLAFREMMDNGFDALYAEMAKIIEEYEEAGLDLPEVATWLGDKEVVVNLKMALAQMGTMRGWYFPRQRKSGDYVVIAKKKGANPIMEIFELAGFANRRCTELQKQGYTAYKKDTTELPEDVFQMAGKTVGLNAMINLALSKTIPEKMPTFEEYGLTPIMRTGPTGRKDFIVRGPTNKKTNAVMKGLGGRMFSAAAGEPKAWHFFDAPSDMSFRVLRALITAKGIPGAAESDLLFAHALAVEVANVVKGRGFRSAMVARRPETAQDVWVGYDTDPLEVASRYVTGLASGLAKKEVASKMVQAMTGTDVKPHQFESFEVYLDAVADRRIDPAKQKHIFHDTTKYVQEMLRNQEFSDRFIGVIKGVTVLKYLGFRLASPLVNLTALVTSVPATMHGLAKIPGKDTFVYLVKAMDVYYKYSFGDKEKLDPDLVDMLDHIQLKGWDNAQYNMEALAVLRSKLGNKWKWTMEKAMLMFGTTEKINRVATIMGTYMALKNQGKTNVSEMRDLAKTVSDQSHGTYGRTTYPYIALGKNPAAQAAQCLYVFSKFSHTYLQNMYELGYKKHEWMSLLWMAFAPAILAGAGSVPFIWPLLMSSLRGIFDADDPEETFYSWFDDNFGEFIGNVARYGIAGAGGYGISLKGSLAIDPIESFPTRLPEIFGAPGNVYTDLWDGGKSLFKGDIFGAAQKMGPRVTGSMMQAYNEERYGVRTRTKTPKFLNGKKMEPENLDSILRFLNFNPAHMAKIKEQKWSQQRLVAKYRDLRSDLYGRVRAYYHKPQARRSRREYLALLADIDEYNKRVQLRKLYEIKGISIITKQTIKTALKLKK